MGDNMQKCMGDNMEHIWITWKIYWGILGAYWEILGMGEGGIGWILGDIGRWGGGI